MIIARPDSDSKPPRQLAADATLRRIVLGDTAGRPDIPPDVIDIDLTSGQMITIRLPRGDVLKIEAVRRAAMIQCGALLRFHADDQRGAWARRSWLAEVADGIEAGRKAAETGGVQS